MRRTVDPVVALELGRCHTWTKAASGIERSSSVVDAGYLADKEGHSYADWRDEGRLGFLSGQHQNDEDQVRGQELEIASDINKLHMVL